MKCNNCKEQFIPRKFNFPYCQKDDCESVGVKAVIAKSKQLEDKKWQARKKQTKEDLMTVSDWIKVVEKYFNKFIRLRDKGKPCVSCGVPYQSTFQAGHFYSAGGHWVIRFDESNTHSQCLKCNLHLSGNLMEYRKQILNRISQDELNRIDDLSTMDSNFTRMYLKHLSEVYKNKCKNLG
jgi:hypothetical protein